MGKKSKFAMAMAGIGLCVGSAFMLGGCNWDKNKTTNEQIYAIYETAVDNGYTGTYQEWLDSIKGEKGAKGDPGKDGSVVTIGEDGYWYIDGVKTEVLALGRNGADGQTPAISISADGYWVINGTKTDARAKGDKGDDGQNGIDGREIEFNKSATHIQWRYKTTDNSDAWKDLIALSELKGETGEKGDNGLDGMITYEEYRQAKPNYRKTKAEFMNDMLAGKLAPIASEDTIGDVNDDGEVNFLDWYALDYMRENSISSEAEYYARGDVDLNGVIDLRDSAILGRLTVMNEYFPDKCSVDRSLLPIRYQYGDINMDGVVDNNDLTLLSNMTDAEYEDGGFDGINFTRYTLCHLGYEYTQEQSKYVLEHYLNGDIKSLDHKIHFVEVNYNGYETSLPTQYVFKDYGEFNLKLSDRAGYKFKGWKVGRNTELTSSFIIKNDDNITIKVTAIWEDTRANVSKNLEFTKNADDTYTLTGIGTNTDENLVIPAYYDGMLVTGIKLDKTNEEKTTNIKQIVVPFGVNNVDIRCGFESLETIIVDENNKTYDSRDNCNAIIEKATNTLVFGCKGTVIPDSVTKIYSYAFYDSNIETLTISENITEIDNLFLNTTSKLKTLIINNSNVKLYRAMLLSASSIETIVCNNVDFWTAPLDGVEFKDTFEDLRCDNLKNLYIPQGITPVNGLLDNYTKQATSDREGYGLWTKNA